MNHSPRYQKVKNQIPPQKIYSVPESLNFLQAHNFEKEKGIKVTFTLNRKNQKSVPILKNKIVLPYPISSKGKKIAVVEDDLPTEIVNKLTKIEVVELLSIAEAYQRTIVKNNKIKKKTQ